MGDHWSVARLQAERDDDFVPAFEGGSGEIMGRHYKRRRRIEFLDFMGLVVDAWFHQAPALIQP